MRLAGLAAALVLAVTATAGATACGDGRGAPGAGTPSAATSATPRPGGTYDFPLQYDITTFAPFAALWEDNVVLHQIYEGLTAYETMPDGTVRTVPCLAQDWTADEDATVWTFHLRRGVRFHAPVGREVTAADVVADFRYCTRASTKSLYANMYNVIRGTSDDGTAGASRLGVEAVDRYTVRFTLKHPFAAFPDTLGGAAAWVWPVDYLRRAGREAFEAAPAGTGPFLLSRRVAGEYIDLVRNPAWWDAASGRPYLAAVHFELFESVSAELRAFQEGRLDFTWVPRGQVTAARSLPEVRSGEWEAGVLPVAATALLGFDMRDGTVGGDTGLPLRQAIDAAVDRASLVAAVSDGVYIPQTGLVPPIFPGWKDEQPPQACDPARARQLYESAGSPKLTLTCLNDRLGMAVAQWLKQACAAAGIPLAVRAVRWNAYAAMYQKGDVPPMCLSSWGANSYDGFLYEMYESSLSPYTSGTAYSDPDVDRLLQLARSTPDEARRLELSRRAAHEIAADVPVIPLFQFADFRLLSTRIGGFTPNPMYVADMWRLWVK